MMCVKTVKNRLALLPPEMRDFFIAEKAMLFYRPGGGDAYTGEKGTKKFRATDIVNDYDCCYPDAKFVDSKGIERNVRELEKKRIDNKLYSVSWELASLCARMVGVDDVLSMYGKELSAMKKFRRQAIEGTLSAPKNDGEEKYTISAETGRYIAALKGMPRQMREAYLAEKMGFCFTPGGEAAYEDRGHICTREGVRVSHYHAYANARFVCSNGKECPLYAGMEKKSAYKQGIERLNGLAKIVMTSLFGSAEEAILKRVGIIKIKRREYSGCD